MISPLQAFSSLPILPSSRLRASTGQIQNEELAKALRQKEGASAATNYTVNVPQSAANPYATQNPEASRDTTIDGRSRRYRRGDADEAQAQSTAAPTIGLFSFAPAVAAEQTKTLAAVQPLRPQLDSASFVSLYSSNDSLPSLSAAERNAQPFAIASQALASRFSFGEELALNVAA